MQTAGFQLPAPHNFFVFGVIVRAFQIFFFTYLSTHLPCGSYQLVLCLWVCFGEMPVQALCPFSVELLVWCWY